MFGDVNPICGTKHKVVLHVLSHPWEFGYYWDAEGGKSVPKPNYGDCGNLWELEGTHAQDGSMPGGGGVGDSGCFDENPAGDICVFDKIFLAVVRR